MQRFLKTILESGSSVNVSMLTVVIQREVILGVAEFLWSTRDENIVVTKEILKASNLLCRKTKDTTRWVTWQQKRDQLGHNKAPTL